MLFTFMLHSQLPYKPQEQHSVLILPSFSCEDKHDYFFLYVQGLLCLTVSPFMARHMSLFSVVVLVVASSLFHFLAVVPFPAWPKPKIQILGLSMLRNQSETLAIQANLF